ncbi:hypothetical protein [Sphingobacterium anhuiense]|uniref:hypothetical protein n=1 Tax=Sphingobacterium anhuiense TaxID=493780 RepID=UPI003C2E2C39
MCIKYYLNTDDSGISTVFVTGRSEYWLEKVRLEISPPLGKEIVNIDDYIDLEQTIGLGFDFVNSEDFQVIFIKMTKNRFIKDLGFHNCHIDLKFDCCLTLDHLYIGENVNIDMTSWNIITNKITLLSLKTFKGYFSSSIPSVEKLTIWDDKDRLTEVLKVFYNIKTLSLTNSNIEDLDLNHLLRLIEANLAYCKKLKTIEANKQHEIKKIILRRCNKYIPSKEMKNLVIRI